MTLFDVFKVNTLDNRGQVSLVTATFSLLCAFGLGLVIHSVYRKVFSGVMYSRPYNTSLIMLTMLTAFVILPVTSDIRLSLGMVGALSIVRFRTAIKDPLGWCSCSGRSARASSPEPGSSRWPSSARRSSRR